MFIHGDATISVVAIDSRVQLVTCHATLASSTFQMLNKGGQDVEVLFTGTLDGELRSLMLGRSLVLLVGGDIDKVLLALFTPEVGLLHVGKVNGGEGGLLIFHGLLVANYVMALAVEVVDKCGVIAEVGTACYTLILVDMQHRALVVYESLKG